MSRIDAKAWRIAGMLRIRFGYGTVIAKHSSSTSQIRDVQKRRTR